MVSTAEAIRPVAGNYLCVNFWLCYPELPQLYYNIIFGNKLCSIKTDYYVQYYI